MIFIMKLHGKNVNKPRSPRSQTYTELLTLFSTPQTSRWTLRLKESAQEVWSLSDTRDLKEFPFPAPFFTGHCRYGQ